jgi:hypothetical protein
VGGGTKIMITQQAANSTKSIKIQPKPEPGINSALPVVTVPKINKGKFIDCEICIFIYQKYTGVQILWVEKNILGAEK